MTIARRQTCCVLYKNCWYLLKERSFNLINQLRFSFASPSHLWSTVYSCSRSKCCTMKQWKLNDKNNINVWPNVCGHVTFYPFLLQTIDTKSPGLNPTEHLRDELELARVMLLQLNDFNVKWRAFSERGVDPIIAIKKDWIWNGMFITHIWV